VDVLGHKHVAVHTEIELLPSFLKDIQKRLFDAVIVEQRASLVTTARDEVRISDVITALEMSGHESKVDESMLEVGDGQHRRRCCGFLVFPDQ
jgi:hypothetical protein